MTIENIKKVFKLDLVHGKEHSRYGGCTTLAAYAWYIDGNSVESKHIYGCDAGTESNSFSFKEPEFEMDTPYLIGYTLYGTPEQVAAITTTHYAVDIDHERTRY